MIRFPPCQKTFVQTKTQTFQKRAQIPANSMEFERLHSNISRKLKPEHLKKRAQIPANSMEFERLWKRIHKDEGRVFGLLNGIPPEKIPVYFKGGIEDSIVLTFVKCIGTYDTFFMHRHI
jgi:hypothetical protein